tara:strand:- start:72 stop:287 length:216 start_codon:yes stop_codon:yes gene_type:complete
MIIEEDRIRIANMKGTSRPIDPVEPKPRRDFSIFIRFEEQNSGSSAPSIWIARQTFNADREWDWDSATNVQ